MLIRVVVGISCMDSIIVGTCAIGWLFVLEAAYHDYTEMEIPDIINAGIWAILAFLSLSEPLLAVTGAFAFTLILGLNSALVVVKQSPILSWGDVLLIPPVAGIMSIIPATIFVLMIILMIAFYRGYKKEEPLAPYVLAAYSVFLICIIKSSF